MRRAPQIALFLLPLALSACGSEPPREERRTPIEVETDDPAAALAADPARLKSVRRQCRVDREAVGAALCEAAARATRMRFMGEDIPTYTPADEAPDANMAGID